MAYQFCSQCFIEKDLGQFQPKGRPAAGGFIRNPTSVCKGCRQGNASRKHSAKVYARVKAARIAERGPETKICQECQIEYLLEYFRPKGRPHPKQILEKTCRMCRRGNATRAASARWYKKKVEKLRNETPVASV